MLLYWERSWVHHQKLSPTIQKTSIRERSDSKISKEQQKTPIERTRKTLSSSSGLQMYNILYTVKYSLVLDLDETLIHCN